MPPLCGEAPSPPTWAGPGRGLRLWPLLALALLGAAAAGCAAHSATDGEAAAVSRWAEKLPGVLSSQDRNQNGLSDTLDLIEGGRREIKNRPYYRSRYIERGGYPPSGEGVCTDLIWRAYLAAGYDLKSMINLDASLSPASYPRIAGRPDPNIDFRRVPNQKVFFERFGRRLTTALKPGDEANLAQWQAGDIVTFKDPDHVALVSPRRNARGVPYLIHNPGPRPVEADDLWPLYRQGRLTGHYRFP